MIFEHTKHQVVVLFFAGATAAVMIGVIIALFSSPASSQRVMVKPPVTSAVPIRTTISTQHRLDPPPLEYLTRVAGDPPLQPGEHSVRVPILLYHHIRPVQPSFTYLDRRFTVTPEAFEAQMRALTDAGYVTITPFDLHQALTDSSITLPKKSILLTFDDGFQDQYQYAFPILEHLGLRATFFIVTRASKRSLHLTDEMIQALDKSGFITIASHTKQHVSLPKLSHAVRQEELVGSKKDLEALLGHPVLYFAYPYGGWTVAIAREVEEAGYELGFGVRLGSLHTSSSRFQLRRMHVDDRQDVVALSDRFLKPLPVSASISRP